MIRGFVRATKAPTAPYLWSRPAEVVPGRPSGRAYGGSTPSDQAGGGVPIRRTTARPAPDTPPKATLNWADTMAVVADPEVRTVDTARRRLAMSPENFRRLAMASLVMVALIVITGAAVRLSGSGLGCPDWPTCYQQRITPQLSLHPLVEFGNRMVTVVVTIVVGVTFVASFVRAPRRRDLVWLSAGLVAGVAAQAFLGALVVYTKLNPYLVMVHFLASMLLVVDAVVLVHRCTRSYAPGDAQLLVPRPVLNLSRGLLALVAVTVAAGTATTGAGPHAGSQNGQEVAKRIPVALRDMATVHSSLALLLVGVALSLVVTMHVIDLPERVRRTGRIFIAVLVAQAAVGYTQYLTHLPPLLVEVHVIGATSIVIGATRLQLAWRHHPRERIDSGGTADDESAAPPTHEPALPLVPVGSGSGSDRATTPQASPFSGAGGVG